MVKEIDYLNNNTGEIWSYGDKIITQFTRKKTCQAH